MASIAGPLIAVLVSCHDGDTCRMEVEVWLDMVVTTQVRVRGIDAPEIAGRCPRERVLAKAARDELGAILETASAITLTKIEADKYGGRVLANVWADGTLVGALLIPQGLARPYAGGAREGWCG